MATFTGDGSNNALSGTASADDIYGLGGSDILYGHGGNDTLDGGAGVDTMYGGTGDDYYFVDDVNDSVRENPGEGTWDTIISTVSYALYAQHGANVENLYLVGNADLAGVGDDQANTILGNTGANLLVGNGGNDSLFGFGDVSFEGITPPVAYGSVDGNDTLDGGAGADLMWGGEGDDVYFVDSAGDRVYEFDGEGEDVVVSSVSYSAATLGALSMVETIYLVGNANINATGNVSNNYLIGNTGANLLLGNEGNDTLIGFSDMSIELGLATPIAYGAVDGNDTLDGGVGADMMAGGDGNDVYYVDSTGDTVYEFSGGGTDDVIISSVSWSMSFNRGREVESIYLAGSSNLNITGDTGHNKLYGNTGANQISGGDGNDYLVGYGNVTTARGLATPLAYGTVDGNDTLDGGAGNDTLDGGAGNDLMTGGTGDDYYIVDSTGDVVQESDTVSGGAWDVIESSVNYSLIASSSTAGVEGLILSGAATTGRGNALSNGIAGSDLANSLYGEDGNDTIYGFGGNDSVWGGNGHDVLAGDSGNDVLYGEAGNDVLEGGEGNDTLQGGTGNDTYVFYSGFGSDLINNATTTSSTDLDVVQFGDASYNTLWFKQAGNNLEISEVGTTDKVQVQNWFSDATARIDQFQSLGSGMQLDASKVAGLVSAMAGFSPQDMSSGAPAGLIAARDAAWQAMSA